MSNENHEQWTARVLYSGAGLWGLASLWDTENDKIDNPYGRHEVSVDHCKKRMETFLNAGCSCLNQRVFSDTEKLAEHIYEVYKDTGNFYHRPYRLSPINLTLAEAQNNIPIYLMKGWNPCQVENARISGLGLYIPQAKRIDKTKVKSLSGSFGLESMSIQKLWEIISKRFNNWRPFSETSARKEFLYLRDDQYKTYWRSQPQENLSMSLLRLGEKGTRSYYIYRRSKTNEIEVMDLPLWQCEKGNYLTLALVLKHAQAISSEFYYRDLGKNYVEIEFGFLLPPAEQSFYQLYTWPEKCNRLIKWCM